MVAIELDSHDNLRTHPAAAGLLVGCDRPKNVNASEMIEFFF